MKIGLCTIAAPDRSLQEITRIAKKVGFDGLEITARPPHLDPEQGADAARKVGDMVRNEGLEVIAYGSYLGRVDQTSIKHAEREVAIAAALETKILRVWAESKLFRQSVDLIQATADLASKHKIIVVIERHRDSVADTPDRIEKLLRAIDRPNVGLNYQVLDLKQGEPTPDPNAELAQLLPYTRYVHLKNYKASSKPGYLPFESLASGLLNYRTILKALKSYSGPLMIEFLSDKAESLKKKLSAEIRFLRSTC